MAFAKTLPRYQGPIHYIFPKHAPRVAHLTSLDLSDSKTWKINSFSEARDVVGRLQANPALTKEARHIAVFNNVLEKEEDPDKAYANLDWNGKRKKDAKVGAEFSAPITELLTLTGPLFTFTWTKTGGQNMTRPAAFWEALWRKARGLEELDILFYTHELGQLVDVVFGLSALTISRLLM